MKKLAILFLLCGCSSYTPVLQPTDRHLYTAGAMVGLHERNDRYELREILGVDPVRYQWCAAFVNTVLNLHDIPGSETVSDHPLMARSFLDWGYEVYEPQRGDVVVFPRGNQDWQGHVGFYVMTQYIDGVKYYVILGGNQDNQVSFELYRAATALGIRRYGAG